MACKLSLAVQAQCSSEVEVRHGGRQGASTPPACTRSHTTEGRRAAQSGSCTAPRRTSTCCGCGWPLLPSVPADGGQAPKLAAMLPTGSGATTAAWLSGSCTAGRPPPLPAMT
jgi:hypothetical protein